MTREPGGWEMKRTHLSCWTWKVKRRWRAIRRRVMGLPRILGETKMRQYTKMESNCRQTGSGAGRSLEISTKGEQRALSPFLVASRVSRLGDPGVGRRRGTGRAGGSGTSGSGTRGKQRIRRKIAFTTGTHDGGAFRFHLLDKAPPQGGAM